MNIVPFLALQTYYIAKKHRKQTACETCRNYRGWFNKCKKGNIPADDYKYCDEI